MAKGALALQKLIGYLLTFLPTRKKKISPALVPSQALLQKAKHPLPHLNGFLVEVWPQVASEDFDLAPRPLPTFATFTPETLPALLYLSKAVNTLTVSQYKKTFIKAVFSSVPPRYQNVHGRARLIPSAELTTPLVLAAAAVPPNFRYASIAQTLLTQAVRRMLLLVEEPLLRLEIRGVFATFHSFWSRLNTPSEELFAHPLTGAAIFDISARRFRNNTWGVGAALSAALNLTDTPTEVLKAFNVAHLQEFFAASALADPLAPTKTKRYSLVWAECVVSLQTPHGYIKKKRARSIKKRLAKRLVRATLRRYWVL